LHLVEVKSMDTVQAIPSDEGPKLHRPDKLKR
jgi:hypothetical protein